MQDLLQSKPRQLEEKEAFQRHPSSDKGGGMSDVLYGANKIALDYAERMTANIKDSGERGVWKHYLYSAFVEGQKQSASLTAELERARNALKEISEYKGQTNLWDCCVHKDCTQVWDDKKVISPCLFQFGVNRGFETCAEIAQDALTRISEGEKK